MPPTAKVTLEATLLPLINLTYTVTPGVRASKAANCTIFAAVLAAAFSLTSCAGRVYYTNGNEPVWKYVELSDENKDNFILENGEPQEFTVYDVYGQEIPDIKAYRLTNENNEALYLHTSHVWSYEKINHYRAENVFCPLASFSNVENEYALLSSAAWADNIIAKENN